MARSRQHPASPQQQQQLTLEDWEQTLSAAREAREAHPTAAAVDAATSVGAPAKKGDAVRRGDAEAAPRSRPVAVELLAVPEALLTRTHLRELGLERRAVDAVFRALPVVALPGYSRPMVRAQDYLKLVKCHTFNDDRVRPIARAS
jgi:hypothetical protein